MNDAITYITNDATYKQVLVDSFGGVMYNVANQDKYDGQHLVDTWDKMSENDKSIAGGIMKGAIDFLKGEE